MFFLKNLVSQTFASWNQIGHVLRRLEALECAAGSAYGAIHISKGP
jgi:conjugal transfer/entry exclusion protein